MWSKKPIPVFTAGIASAVEVHAHEEVGLLGSAADLAYAGHRMPAVESVTGFQSRVSSRRSQVNDLRPAT